jgi:hypothetical protein
MMASFLKVSWISALAQRARSIRPLPRNEAPAVGGSAGAFKIMNDGVNVKKRVTTSFTQIISCTGSVAKATGGENADSSDYRTERKAAHQPFMRAGMLVFTLACQTGSYASDFGDPYFLTDGTFGLETDLRPGHAEFVITTFLPHHSLIFKDKAQVGRKIGDDQYERVITQNGQRLLIPSRKISTKTFPAKYGQSQIIFHEDAYMCPPETPSRLFNAGSPPKPSPICNSV